MEIVYAGGAQVVPFTTPLYVGGAPLVVRLVDVGYIAGEAPDAVAADGRATLDNVPGVVEVRLFSRESFALVAKQMSRADGTYRFEGLTLGVQYDIIGRDLTNTWDDVIVSRVLPYAPPQITTASLAFVVGTPAATRMAAQYGGEPFIWSADVLPPGLSLSATGLWGGTPTTAGSYTVAVTVVDVFSESSTRTYTVTVT